MADYIYERELLSEGDYQAFFNINNPERSSLLCKEITASTTISKTLSVPGLVCIGTTCVISFSENLTTEEQAALTILVNNHKNNI